MEPVTLTAVATAIATLLLTKALEQTGKNLGDAAWQESRKLIELLRHKNKLPLLTTATQGNEQQKLDYGQAVLELKAVAETDPEIAQGVREVEAAAKADPKLAPQVEEVANTVNSQQPTIQNLAKLAEKINNLNQAQNITIHQTNTF